MTYDKDLLKMRFAARLESYNSLAVVQQEICSRLAEMAGRFCRVPAVGKTDAGSEIAEKVYAGSEPEVTAGPVMGAKLESAGHKISKGFEVGAGTGFLTRRLLELFPRSRWTVNDLVEEAEGFIAPLDTQGRLSFLWGDAENIRFPRGMDMIASASTVQWFDELSGFTDKALEALVPGGYLLLSTFGPENFREIKTTVGQGLEYLTASGLEETLTDSGFEVIEISEYITALEFASPSEVLRHIKATGVNAIEKTRWTKSDLAAFEALYRERFTTAGGKITLTFHPILIVARKKESQAL